MIREGEDAEWELERPLWSASTICRRNGTKAAILRGGRVRESEGR